MTEDAIDYDGLLQANLSRIFSEADADKRRAAITQLYAPDAVLYEPGHIATGHVEITRTIDALLESFPPDFSFSAEGPAVGHHGLARLRWRAGPPGAAPVVTGTDVVRVDGGRITSIHVFLDPRAA